MKAFPSTVALLACSMVSAAPPSPDGAKPVRFAVVALGQCSSAASALSARSFRALLQPKLGAGLQSEADSAKPLGGLSERTLDEVARAVTAARSDFYAHKGDSALGHLKELAVDVTRIAPSEDRWKVEREVLTLLAQVQLPNDSTGAEATLVSILRVEPGYQPDSGLYPPSFRKVVDGLRARQAEAPTNRLDVAVSPAGKTVYVGGYPAGAAPLSHHFPLGEYRVEADFGHRSLIRTVVLPPQPALVAPLQLAIGIEGSLFADGGPCVEPAPDRSASLARMAALTGANRIYALHSEVSEGRRWVVLEDTDASGNLLRQARSQVQAGVPETEALGLLAEWAVTGRGGSAVEVLKRASTANTAPANPLTVHPQVSGTIVGQPRPNGFMVQAFPSSGQAPPSPGVHFSADTFKLGELPTGKTTLRVVTDDGRVGTAPAEVPSAGSVDVTVKVDVACTAVGRVIKRSGEPAAGAHLVAQLLGSRISQSSQTGPKGGFLMRELTRGDYQLTIELGDTHAVRRFSVGSTCASEIGKVVLPDASPAGKPPGVGTSAGGAGDH